MRRLIDNIEAIPAIPVVTFVDGEGQDVATVDFGSLGLVARQIAGRLRGEAGVQRGDRVLMLYTPSLEFVHALAGCLVAGVVPVPVCPPDPFNLRREMGRLRAIVQDCNPAVALCNAEYAQVRDLGDLRTGGDGDATVWPELRWLQTDDPATNATFDPVAIRDDELAVLQYTSGSTGDPKGVAITHANVEHQCELNRRRLGLTPESRAVIWVPHYHDFGLISGIMNAFSGHGHMRLLSPLSFVARPSVWFQVSDATRALLESLATEDAIGSVERYFRFGDVALPFPEVYPEDAIRSDRVRGFAERCFSTAFAARFFDVVRTPEARATLELRLEGDLIGGLRPGGKLQEVLFSLLYLSRAGVDLTTSCPQAMAYLRDAQRPYGVGLDERALDVDVDSTAIAMIVSAEQGIPCVVERGSSVLERMWNEDRGSYRSTLGYFFNTNMLLLGARATLCDPGATAEQQRAVWEHTLEHLDRRQWLSVDHISPLYLWETAVSFLFEFEHRFPDLPTHHHHEVVDLILGLQVPSGGFQSYLFDEPDPEETALGLLALKAALAGDLDDEQRERVAGAVDRAQAWLAPRFAAAAAAEEHHHPEEWIGDLMFTDRKLSESILIASLLKEPRGRWAVGALEADLAATP